MASRLLKELHQLRPKMAAAAQRIYDEWQQDDEGVDEVCGYGGICDTIADAISDVVAQHVGGAEIFEGGQPGDDHAWTVVQRDGEAFGVDIPPNMYEYGGGYNWKKKHGVVFRPDYIVIFPVPLQEE